MEIPFSCFYLGTGRLKSVCRELVTNVKCVLTGVKYMLGRKL